MSDIDYHLIDVYKDGSIHLRDKIGPEARYMQIVTLKTLKDFNVNDYYRKNDTIVKFKDCGHIFTFGDVDAYLDDKYTLHGGHVASTDLYCWAIAFGNGNAINKGHGPAVTFGYGNAYSFNKSITFGKGKAVVETTLSYKHNSLNLKEPVDEDIFNFYNDVIKRFNFINQFSYAETYGSSRASHTHETIVDGVIYKKDTVLNGNNPNSANKRLSMSHGFTKESDSWVLPENTPYLNMGWIIIGVMMCTTGRSTGFNTTVDNLPDNSKMTGVYLDGILEIDIDGQKMIKSKFIDEANLVDCRSRIDPYNNNPYETLRGRRNLHVAPVFNDNPEDNPIKLEYTGRFNT